MIVILQSPPNRDDDPRERRHTGAGMGAAAFAVPGVAPGATGTKLILQQPASAAMGDRSAVAAAPDLLGSRMQQAKTTGTAAALGTKKKVANPELAEGAVVAGQGEKTAIEKRIREKLQGKWTVLQQP